MNIGLVTSYIIAGIILLAILTMNISLSSSSTELSLTQITREKAATISDMITHDIQKIGYNRNSKTSPIITTGEGKKIVFRSNIDNSTDNSVEIITWEFTGNEVTTSDNPNDYILKRTVRDAASGSIITDTPIKSGVTGFRVSYFDDYGKPLSDTLSTPVSASDLSKIKQLHITIELQSGEKIYSTPSSPGRYVTSVWEKRFSPPNLEF
ncbi:MAG: hypothetical protein PVI44_12900 [Balneolaceae bacterium]|jgi:hypothetical protein